MAAKFPSDSGIKLKPRKGHDMTWSCDKHAEPISLYCKDHSIPLCLKCAFNNHQKPCQVQDIEDVILEMRKRLDETQSELDEMLQRAKKLNYEIQSCSKFVSNHLESVNTEVNSTYEDKIKFVEAQKEQDILQINKEADEEIKILNEKIRIINQKRDRRVESRTTEADQEELTIKEIQAKILSESKEIGTTVGKKMADLKSNNQHGIDTINNVDLKITRIKRDDKTLVNEAPQVITSLDENISAIIHQDIKSCLARIQSEVERVKFVEGEIGGKHFARIDCYNETWKLAKSFPVTLTLNSPVMCGLISDDEICVTDDGNNLYISNIRNGHTIKVIEGGSDMWVSSCAPIDSESIVCCKGRRDCKGDILNGCITIYDRQWKVVKDIAIPRNQSDYNLVYVDVDNDGMILAAQDYQYNIYVINPADGKIVHTIKMQGKRVWGEIQAFSSGDIVVKTGGNEFTVISRSGEAKATIRHDEWKREPWCQVDKLTDTLYIGYLDLGRDIRAVDQVSRDGEIQAMSVVKYKGGYGRCLITPSNNLIVRDELNTLVYKKTLLG